MSWCRYSTQRNTIGESCDLHPRGLHRRSWNRSPSYSCLRRIARISFPPLLGDTRCKRICRVQQERLPPSNAVIRTCRFLSCRSQLPSQVREGCGSLWSLFVQSDQKSGQPAQLPDSETRKLKLFAYLQLTVWCASILASFILAPPPKSVPWSHP